MFFIIDIELASQYRILTYNMEFSRQSVLSHKNAQIFLQIKCYPYWLNAHSSKNIYECGKVKHQHH